VRYGAVGVSIRNLLWEFGKLQRSAQGRVYEAFAKLEQATQAGTDIQEITNIRNSIGLDPRRLRVLTGKPRKSELYSGAFGDIPTEQSPNVCFRQSGTVDEIVKGEAGRLHEFYCTL
jgi:hypothetical protein